MRRPGDRGFARSVDKNLKAVLITGDTSSAIREVARDPYLRFASKPVRADESLTLLEALLGT